MHGAAGRGAGGGRANLQGRQQQKQQQRSASAAGVTASAAASTSSGTMAGARTAAVPAAPYPPVMRTSGPPAPAYSSAAVGATPSTATTAAAAAQLHVQVPHGAAISTVSAQQGQQQLALQPTVPPAAATPRPGRVLPARIGFCPARRDVYGAVNCLPTGPYPAPSASATQAQQPTPSAAMMSPGGAQGQSPSRIKKLGPVLLELRHLLPGTDPTLRRLGHCLVGGTVAVSRGNPALGAGVASTCLSFRPGAFGPPLDGGGGGESGDVIQCATGLTSGALCIHTVNGLDGAIAAAAISGDPPIASSSADPSRQQQQQQQQVARSTVTYFAPRHHRPATAVAWRPGPTSSELRHVAIGLVGSGGGDRGGTTHAGGAYHGRHRIGIDRGGGLAGSGSGSGLGGVGGAGGGSSGDREFCCLVWDVQTQGGTAKGTAGPPGQVSVKAPAYRFAHNAGVASLSWLMDGQLLAVGCQHRNVQLYDLRIKGTNAPPVSVYAHSDAVSGIEADPYRPNVFATFSRAYGEPVKLWDARRMDTSIGEIKTASSGNGGSAGGSGSAGIDSVTALAWSTSRPGTLTVATGDAMRSFDITVSGSRPNLTRVRHCPEPVQCIAFQPEAVMSGDDVASSLAEGTMSADLYPHRMLVVQGGGGTVRDLPKFQVAPVAISRRDGRVAHSLGRAVWMGSTASGPSAMESMVSGPDADISATMMKRARCLHATRYSTDASSNLQMLADEMIEDENIDPSPSQIGMDSDEGDQPSTSSKEELWRLWRWIERVEQLSSERDDAAIVDEVPPWPAKGLIDAGAYKLLRMDSDEKNDYHLFDVVTQSDTLGCNTYDSPMRRAALNACGWTGKYGLRDVLVECEAQSHFERSAALAVWHGDLGAAVAALQRGADRIRLKVSEDRESGKSQSLSAFSVQYAETLQLVAMCVAGYSGNSAESSKAAVWRTACEGLLQRHDLSPDSKRRAYVPYLRAACTFLLNIGRPDGLDKVLYEDSVSLSDRVAFACVFLARRDLKTYLGACIEQCQERGNLEGVLITGMDKQGIALVQSYVDAYSDVQTAALVSSRVILPSDWVTERVICSEWLDSYRDLLNTWQMWQSRAMFDVGRAELLRRLKGRMADDLALGSASASRGVAQHQGRRGYGYNAQGRRQSQANAPASAKQNEGESSIANFPPQLYARCNYCNTSLPLSRLRRQEGIANSWLSRQKPVLSCCPQCRKPLPRCALCLLPLGCLNPYMELQRMRNRITRSGQNSQDMDDLSAIANLPFAEWFTWCMRCKHGGHAHHLVGWFANHKTCAVSGCDCQCQFDGIQKLSRPGLAKKDG